MLAFRILDLPFELLLEITAWLNQTDLSRLSRICKVIHSSLAPLLTLRPAHIQKGRLQSFIQSLSTGGEGDSDGRFHLLRSLVVEDQVIDPDGYIWDYLYVAELYQKHTAPVLVELLGRTSSLVRLEIRNVRTTLTLTQLRTALASLRFLREISLNKLTVEYLTVLAEVSAPLRRIELTTGGDLNGDWEN
ncbi:hypothetical protein ACG7TL_001231 [Trametes sanguinea]